MSTNNIQRTTMLRYWTTRYLLTVFIGLIVIGIISILWIKYSATEKRLDIMKLLAEEIAERVVDSNGNLNINPSLDKIIDRRGKYLDLKVPPFFLVVDKNKRIVYNAPKYFPVSLLEPIIISLENEKNVQKIRFKDGEKLYLVKQKFVYNTDSTGWIILLYPQEDIAQSAEEIQIIVVMLLSLALLGWGVIYWLTRKMAKPIQDVAGAAKQIVEGNYEIHLEKSMKEKEIFELVHSFKEMSDRLKQLEMMRTELLAGVTMS